MPDRSNSPGRSTVFAVYLMFFVSGMASLIYQTIWIRKFSQVLGGTVFSMSVVVSTFMAGLAVGAAVIGRVADRFKRPLVLYALVELSIGVGAIVLAFTDSARAHMVSALIHSPQLEGTLLIRVAISVLWLGVPCFLIGGTLPVMVRFIVGRLSSLGEQVGTLYFVNTLGASLGSLLTGFVLVETLGLSGSTYVAAAINFAVALLAVFLEWKTPVTSAAVPETRSADVEAAVAVASPRTNALVGVAIVFFVSGFCSLLLEMAWTRIVFGFLLTGVIMVSMNLFMVLLGFAIGGAAIARLADKSADPRRLAGLIFAITGGLSVIGLGSVEVFGFAIEPAYSPTKLQLAAMAGLMFAPSIGMGATFPILVRILVTSQEHLGKQLGGYYALNTVGTVLGGILAPFVLIPTIGTIPTVLLACGLQLAIAFYMTLSSDVPAVGALKYASYGVAFVALAMMPSHWDVYHRTLLHNAAESYPGWATERAYIEGADSTVVLYESSAGASQLTQADDNRYRIQVNASTLVAFDTNETKLMAHMPLVATKDPKRALVICFGVGNTFRSALAHGIDVDVVDINPAIPGLARIHQKNPEKTFGDPRGHIYINDGRNFLQISQDKYDMVTIDPAPPVWGLGLGNIQSREFYQLIASHLTDDGVAEAWMLSGHHGDFESTLAAFRAAFPYVQVFKGAKYIAYHVLGSKSPITFSKKRLEKLFVDPRLLADLGETDISFFSEDLFRKLYITDQTGVDKVIAGVTPVTDDSPFLEYRFLRGLRHETFVFPQEVFKPLTFVP